MAGLVKDREQKSLPSDPVYSDGIERGHIDSKPCVHRQVMRLLVNDISKTFSRWTRQSNGGGKGRFDHFRATAHLWAAEAACANGLKELVQVRRCHIVSHSGSTNTERHLMCNILQQHRINIIGRRKDGAMACVKKRVVLRVIVRVSEQDIAYGDLEEGDAGLARHARLSQQSADGLC